MFKKQFVSIMTANRQTQQVQKLKQILQTSANIRKKKQRIVNALRLKMKHMTNQKNKKNQKQTETEKIKIYDENENDDFFLIMISNFIQNNLQLRVHQHSSKR